MCYRRLIKILCGLLVVISIQAYAIVPMLVSDPLEELRTLYVYQQELKQVKDALANLKSYSGNGGWKINFANQLSILGDIVSQGVALSNRMQDQSAHFQQRYPGYQPQTDYPTAYKNWSTDTMTSLQNTLQVSGMGISDLQNEQDCLNGLQSYSDSAGGRMQAIQAGNSIAAMTVGQLMQLRQMIASESRAQNAYMAYKVQNDQAAEATQSAWINAGDTEEPKYGTGYGFGADNFPQIQH